MKKDKKKLDTWANRGGSLESRAAGGVFGLIKPKQRRCEPAFEYHLSAVFSIALFAFSTAAISSLSATKPTFQGFPSLSLSLSLSLQNLHLWGHLQVP